MLALVAIALVVISVAGLAFLRSYLLGQADTSVAAAATQSGARLGLPSSTMPRPVSRYPIEAGAIIWLPDGGKPQAVALELGSTHALNVPPSGRISAQSLEPGPKVTPGAVLAVGPGIRHGRRDLRPHPVARAGPARPGRARARTGQ